MTPITEPPERHIQAGGLTYEAVYLRLLLVALIVSGLVGWPVGCLSSVLVAEGARWPLALLAGAALGRGLAGGRGLSGHHRWLKLFLLLLGFVWLAVTGLSLLRQWEALAGFGPLAWKQARPYAVSSSLFVGYLTLCYQAVHHRRDHWLPLMMLAPVVMAPLLLANPAAVGMIWLPLLAAVGLAPQTESWCGVSEEDKVASWQEGGALGLEMVSLQTVAWGALLAVTGLLIEWPANGFVSAVFVAFGTGFSAWILSGLLWGAAESLRLRRLSLHRPVRWLFGRQAVAMTPAEKRQR